jgi:aminopeptidase N
MSPLSAQTPKIEPGVSLELAKWRAAHYSDVRYKLDLTLEKMSPVLKGTVEIRVNVSEPPASADGKTAGGEIPPIILDWRRIAGHEEKSTISDVSLNGVSLSVSPLLTRGLPQPANQVEEKDAKARASARAVAGRSYEEFNEHLIFRDGVRLGENVIKLDLTSPILTSGSAITRYIDKEDGSEYIYSLFVPSDASTAFPVFDQPDLKARFSLSLTAPRDWEVITNSGFVFESPPNKDPDRSNNRYTAIETKPISTYVFAFAAGPFERVSEPPAVAGGLTSAQFKSGGASASPNGNIQPPATAGGSDRTPPTDIYVRKSQVKKFEPHAAEVFRLNREAVKYFEQYFDYKFPFPKYDLVLIPEFPFGGMEHAGATFLRESAIIFPQEPTRNDHISRALLIFHEASHQWFGDTVTMRWFDDLWLKEGFATFTAYKAMERIMPEMMAWKVFYERVKQAAYQTDSTKGTTPIYQEIPNLSAAKSAYGNIVYNKAPAFLRQAEFYLGEDKFQTAVRAFLKKHEYANANWQELLDELVEVGWLRSTQGGTLPSSTIQKEAEASFRNQLRRDLSSWITQRSMPVFRTTTSSHQLWDPTVRSLEEDIFGGWRSQSNILDERSRWTQKFKLLGAFSSRKTWIEVSVFEDEGSYGGRATHLVYSGGEREDQARPLFVFPNYQDYGYGIFLLDEKSRDYVLRNIQNEKDPFLRSMMWGALWDSVREGELDPRVFVELAIKQLGGSGSELRLQPREKLTPNSSELRLQPRNTVTPKGVTLNENITPKGVTLSGVNLNETDETIVALLVGRVSTALNYYLPPPDSALADARASATEELRSRFEAVLLDRMRNAPTAGQRITFYRAFLNNASSENARNVLKAILSEPPAVAGGLTRSATNTAERKQTSNDRTLTKADAQPPATAGGSDLPLRTKDKFDIVTRLLILGDADGPRLLAELEKTETSDDAKRYAYAARAGIATAENKAKYWNDFVNNKEISESWIEAAFVPWNSIRHSELTLPYLQRALQELPNHKRNRKIFFVNGWLGAFIGGQRSEEALNIINKFLADNPTLDRDLRLKILENADIIERAVKIRGKFGKN